ncbi:MAG TPA: PTS system mannose/fructose/sorbose family transporter subunit IID [Elusimicrobiota bacterium]|nr:PTS system mannose/fructose/sorbose family transporter subunit IID [Elusimicrobiota bacterium]
MGNGQTLEPVTAAVPAPARLTTGDLWKMFLRSFCIQTLWNFQRMQNLGWLFSLWPALRRFYRPPQRRGVALEHLDYFNTHPYLANLVLGVVAGMEEGAAAGSVRREQIMATKKTMSGPLAALGDTVFWATLRPLAGVLAVALGLTYARLSWWLVPVFFLAAYNSFHLAARVGGLFLGYRHKSEIIHLLRDMRPQKWVRGATLLGAGVSLGALLMLWLAFGRHLGAMAGFISVTLVLLRLRVTSTRVVYAMLAACFCFAYFFGI